MKHDAFGFNYMPYKKDTGKFEENLVKDQFLWENPEFVNNVQEISKYPLKKIEKMTCVDSSYYLG